MNSTPRLNHQKCLLCGISFWKGTKNKITTDSRPFQNGRAHNRCILKQTRSEKSSTPSTSSSITPTSPESNLNVHTHHHTHQETPNMTDHTPLMQLSTPLTMISSTSISVEEIGRRSILHLRHIQGMSLSQFFDELSTPVDTSLLFGERAIRNLLQGSMCSSCKNGFHRIVSSLASPKDIYVSYNLQCNHCRKLTIEIVPNVPSGNLQLYLPSLDAIVTPRKFEKIMAAFIGGVPFAKFSFVNFDISHSMYYRYQQHIGSALVQLADEEFNDYLRVILENKLGLHLASNGAWSHRGYRAKHHSFLIRVEKAVLPDGTSFPAPSILLCICLMKDHYIVKQDKEIKMSGNYSGSSKRMEVEALKLAIEKMKPILPFVKRWVADEDSGTKKILSDSEETKHIHFCHDAGHKKQNFIRSMRQVLGQSIKYSTIANRLGSWYISIIKRVEEEIPQDTDDAHKARKARFEFYWSFTQSHYLSSAWLVNCLCKKMDCDWMEEEGKTSELLEGVINLMEHLDLQEAADENSSAKVVQRIAPISDASKQRKKFFFNVNCPEDMKKWAELVPILEKGGSQVDEVLWLLNTTRSENSNFRRLSYMRKDRFYPSAYEILSLCSALKEKCGLFSLAEKLWAKVGLEMSADIRARISTKQKSAEKDSARKKIHQL